VDESACCSAQKVAALDQALDGLDGWITGCARAVADPRGRAQGLVRRGAWALEGESDRRLDAERVWDYIARNDVPYNALQIAATTDRLRAVHAPRKRARRRWAAARRPSAASTSELTDAARPGGPKTVGRRC